MTKVVIDGIEYVPKAEVLLITDERLQGGGLGSLTEIQYFHEPKHKHRAWACVVWRHKIVIEQYQLIGFMEGQDE